ncbi:MAG: TIR domain-containing protein [Lachnospiraceae bacterium]|nr:TIR domain-containing protein [Lachnospiraceae bacterium]
MPQEKLRYDAFISYRHCELDSFVSENIHKKLESYKLPKSVIKKITNGKTKIERVFRDEAELPLSDNLSDPITEALANSEFLIVICTPDLPKSQWCKKEVETFVQMHGRDHVLLVLANGEPEESFPEILTYEDVKVKDETGKEVTVRMEKEPLAADCRGENNKQRLKAMDNVILKLCAAMFGLNYDDLKQRHRERQIRRRLIAMGAALAIVSVFAVTCLGFIIKISRQNKIIQDKYAGSMASASQDLLSQGLQSDALYSVRNVLPDKEKSGYNPDAYYALTAALAPYEIENKYFPTGSFRVPQDYASICISEDGSYALANSYNFSALIDTEKDTEIYRVESPCSFLSILNDTGIVYIDDEYDVCYLDPSDEEETVLTEEGCDLFYVPGEKVTLAFTLEGIYGYRDLSEEFFIDLGGLGVETTDYSVENMYVTEDGKYVAFAINSFNGTCTGIIDIPGGKIKKYFTSQTADEPVVACNDNTLYICYQKEDRYTGSLMTEVDAIDLKSGNAYTADIPGFGFFDMLLVDQGLMIISDRISYILDDEYLDTVATMTGYMEAVCAFPYEDGCVIVDRSGEMFTDNVYSSTDISFALYGHDSTPLLTNATYVDGDLYIGYRDSGRIVIYSPGQDNIEGSDDMGDAEPFEDQADDDIDTDDLEGIDDISVESTAVSDDGKYTAVGSNDGVLHIFETGSGKKVKEIYNSGIYLMHSRFPYLKKAGVYVIENRVFDEDFNLISRLPNGRIVGIGKDQKSLVYTTSYSEDIYYEVPILSYDEMIEKADKLLGDHVPEISILEKYNITK